jgi:hypothetical protein
LAATRTLLDANTVPDKEILTLPHMTSVPAGIIVGRRPFDSGAGAADVT